MQVITKDWIYIELATAAGARMRWPILGVDGEYAWHSDHTQPSPPPRIVVSHIATGMRVATFGAEEAAAAAARKLPPLGVRAFGEKPSLSDAEREQIRNVVAALGGEIAA